MENIPLLLLLLAFALRIHLLADSAHSSLVLGVIGLFASLRHDSSLDVYDLLERVNLLHQVGLRCHHGIDFFVSGRRLVNNTSIFATDDACSVFAMLLQSDSLPGLATRHRATGSMRA